MTSRIAVIGCGEVGAHTAFALLLLSVCGEILILEKNADKRDAQVRDLNNAACRGGSRTRVRVGTYKEASQCDIIIITAGSKKAAGTRHVPQINRNIEQSRAPFIHRRNKRSSTLRECWNYAQYH
jgi:L-lactate dehydrogenase